MCFSMSLYIHKTKPIEKTWLLDLVMSVHYNAKMQVTTVGCIAQCNGKRSCFLKTAGVTLLTAVMTLPSAVIALPCVRTMRCRPEAMMTFKH